MSEKKNISHTSSNELSHSMVHYLLTIHKLKEDKGYARVTDIAKELGLTKGSVSTSLRVLKKRKLIVEDENKFLELSLVGHDEVHRILSARTLMYHFLKDILKVDENIAHNDSCLVEHLLSGETREGLFNFMKNIVNSSSNTEFETNLRLDQFEKHIDFFNAQRGDKYL